MTTRGRALLGAGVVTALVGMVLGLQDLTRVGALLAVLPLLAVLLTRRDLSVRARRRVTPNRVAVDQHCEVTVEVTNTGRRSTPLLRAEEELAYALGDRPHLLIPPLEGGGTRSLTYRVRSHLRGHHRIGPLSLRLTDSFGLATRSVSLTGETTLVVLPRVLPLPGVRGARASGGGQVSTSSRVALHGEDDVGVREFRHGDDLRRVHWPSTARTGQTMVRQDEQPSRRRALVLLDDRRGSHAGAGSGGSFEWAVTAAASVIIRLLSDHFEVHLSLASEVSGVLAAVEDADHALDVLAAVEPAASTTPRGMVEALEEFRSHGGGLVFTVLGALDDDVADLCTASSAHGLAMVLDRGGFTTGRTDDGPAEATARRLREHGWSAVVVHPGARLDRTWAELTLGRSVVAR